MSRTVVQPSPAAIGLLQLTFMRIKPPAAANKMWRERFTEADRRRLGGDMAPHYGANGTADVWVAANGGTLEAAVIEVGCLLGFLSDADADWLRREFGLTPLSKTLTDTPQWDSETGKLTFGGRLVRKIRRTARPSKGQRILDAFHAAGWKSRIDNPLPEATDHELHKAVQRLNERLSKIRFATQEGGMAVTWRVHPPGKRTAKRR